MNKFKIGMLAILILVYQNAFAGSFSPNQRWISYFWEKNTPEPSVVL